MEILIAILVISLIITIFFLSQFKTIADDHLNSYLKLCGDRDDLNRKIGELQSQLSDINSKRITAEHNESVLQEDFNKLQHQKISADVKLGAKAENLLPFLSQFPYANDEIRGLFNPIDLIVFREDEVVFVEVKSGQSQLSDKQRKIRDNINSGRVRFETHRLDENGIRVK